MKIHMTAVLLTCMIGLTGCMTHKNAVKLGQLDRAVAVMQPTAGNSARGIVKFVQDGARITVIADIEGLSPNAKHAFHIHQWGDCSSPDGKSAGSHYNPEGHEHGNPDAGSPRHAGDLGNIEADAAGKAHYERTVYNLTIADSHNPIIGRSLIIHKKHDDFGQPTGNAGSRIACGTIGVAK